MPILDPDITVLLIDIWSLGRTTKQPLSNFEPKIFWKYKQLWELRPDPSCL